MIPTDIKNWYTWQHHDKITVNEIKQLYRDILDFMKKITKTERPERHHWFNAGISVKDTGGTWFDIMVFYELQNDDPKQPIYVLTLLQHDENNTVPIYDEIFSNTNENEWPTIAKHFAKKIANV